MKNTSWKTLVQNIWSFCTKTKNILLIIFAFVFPISLAATNVILGILFICWIFEGKWKEKLNSLIKNKLVWILYALPVLLIISTLFSNSSVNGFLISSGYKNEYQFIFKHFVWLNLVFIILITSKFDVKKIITAFLFGMFFSEVISYLIYFNLINVSYFKDLHLLYKRAAFYDPSPFMSHTFYSMFLSISILIILDRLSQLNGAIKFIGVLFLLSATVNLFVNGGRTGQIAFLIGIMTYFIFRFRQIRPIVISILFLIFISFIAYKYSPNFKYRMEYAYIDMSKVIKQQNYCGSWGARIGLNIIGINILFENSKNVVFGLGAGDAKEKFFNYGEKKFDKIFKCVKRKIHLHNQYLQFWIDGGILAFLLIILYFIYLYRYSPLPLTAGVITIFAFSFISDVMLYRPKTYILFLFISAILIKLYSSTYHETNSTGRDIV